MVHSSPSVLTLVLHSDLVQQMDHEGRGVTPQPFGEVTQLRQRVKKDSLVLLMAALAPLLCSVTPSSEVRAQLWPRNREHHAAGEMWPGETVPLPSVRDPRGSAPAFCLSPFTPAFGSGLGYSFPFTSARQETQGLKSVGPEGLKRKKSPLLNNHKKQLTFHRSCSVSPPDNCKCFRSIYEIHMEACV